VYAAGLYVAQGPDSLFWDPQNEPENYYYVVVV